MAKMYRLPSIGLVLLVIISLLKSSESYRDRTRRRPDSASLIIPTIRLCSKSRDMKLLCHCTPETAKVALQAECWIIHNNFPRKDNTWLAFKSQPQLTNLKLTIRGEGLLNYIPSEIFPDISALQTVTIDYAQITEVAGYAFANLTQLKKITLNENQIKVLRSHAFANHQSLDLLDLEDNQIIEVDRNAFVNIPNLTKLYLGKNNISILHDEVFIELGQLAELKLQSNFISVLTREMFKGLGNLKILRLTKNNINFIGNTVFAELWSLNELSLDSNNIEKISERAFDGLNNLRKINLKDNLLTVLEEGVLSGVPALTYLNLRGNALKTLTYNNVLPIMDNLVNSTSSLILTENQFVCDCRLKWMYELKERTKNNELRKTLQHTVCITNSTELAKLKKQHQHHHFTKDMSSTNLINKHIEVRKSHISALASSAVVGSNIQQSALDMEEENDYYDDEAYADETRKPVVIGETVSLFSIDVEHLPCPEELKEPTEMPTSSESIKLMTTAKKASAAVSFKKTTASGLLFGLFIFITISFIFC